MEKKKEENVFTICAVSSLKQRCLGRYVSQCPVKITVFLVMSRYIRLSHLHKLRGGKKEVNIEGCPPNLYSDE